MESYQNGRVSFFFFVYFRCVTYWWVPMLIIIIESFLGKYARSARASRQEGVVLVDYAGSHFRPTSQSSHRHKWSGAGGFHSHVSRHFTAPLSSPICPINSPSPPRARRRIPPWHRASSNSDMVRATRSRCYAAASASPPVCTVVVARLEVEHHSAHQRCDRNGRFVAADGSSNARPRGGRRQGTGGAWCWSFPMCR